MRNSKAILSTVVKQIVALLVAGDFDGAEARALGIRLSAGDMEGAIKEYGGTLIMPPDDVFEELDAIEVQGSSPTRWSVRFDLWTKEEGESDLSLELTVEEGTEPKVELDNLHVL